MKRESLSRPIEDMTVNEMLQIPKTEGWRNKPHQYFYDTVYEIECLRNENEHLELENERIELLLARCQVLEAQAENDLGDARTALGLARSMIASGERMSNQAHMVFERGFGRKVQHKESSSDE